MKRSPGRTTLGLIFAGVLALVSAAAVADDPYPGKPIRIIVQFGAGTSTDIVARIVAQKLTQSLGQSVVIENKVGAGGILGTELAARAKPDGYTIVMAVSSVFGIDPTLYARLPFDVLKDFTPITMLVTVPQTLVVPENAPRPAWLRIAWRGLHQPAHHRDVCKYRRHRPDPRAFQRQRGGSHAGDRRRSADDV